jgi:DNA-binding NarL/FixJ family response regulator
MIRIALVDDHELVRTGFRMILSRESDMEIVAEAANGEDAVALSRKFKPDVVLMDVHLPGISGLEATERIARARQGTRVIVVTMQDEQPFPRRLLEAGASGYVTKACPADELVAAVREVARGRRYLSSDVARAMALSSLPGSAQGSPFEPLSARELEVALSLARGESMQEIAERLHLSAKTVATYKYRLFEKLAIENEVALAHLAREHGLLDASATRRSRPPA